MKKILISLLLIYISISIFAKSITKEEKKIFNKMLQKVQLDTTALNFPKNWSSSEFKIKKIHDILEEPLLFPDFVDSINYNISENNHFEYFAETIFETDSLKFDVNIDSVYQNSVNSRLNNIEKHKDIFSFVDFVTYNSMIIYQQSLENITSQELQLLTSFVISLRDEDEEKYAQIINNFDDEDYEIEDIIEIIKKIDLKLLTKSGIYYKFGIDKLSKKRFRFLYDQKKLIEYESCFGIYAIGSSQMDIYDKQYAFVYDSGGNDIYDSCFFTSTKFPFYAVIDKSGDDVYRSNQYGELFSTFFGCGLSYDFAGDDFYSGDDFMFSANFGINIHSDKSGNDQYVAKKHSLAAATFGISILEDKNGNDIYSVSEFGEGFGGPFSVGALIDFNGNDNYFSGGEYLHAPLAPFDYRSLSQGFGFGIRPDIAGGIGIIFDGKGNDHFDGGVFSQAVGYWYSLGIIINIEGNDSYHSVYYPQGSGIHLAGGFLFDKEGEDSYYSKHGPGQGAGHDYGVGFLVDRAGDDCYSVEGGNGLGISNSVGIFLDVSGNDRYERKREEAYGFGKTARSSGSLGIFLDTSGDDVYSNTELSNNDWWKKGNYGVGLDTSLVIPVSEVKKLSIEVLEGIDLDDKIEIIFSYAAQWEVGSSKALVRIARKIMLDREEESTEFIKLHKLDTKSGLEFRAIKEFVKNCKSPKILLDFGLLSDKKRIVKNTISLIGELKDVSYLDILEELLKNKKYTGSVLSALGKIGTDRSIDLLSSFVENENVYIRVICARSLKEINTERSLKFLFQMENDDCFLIESMIRILKTKK